MAEKFEDQVVLSEREQDLLGLDRATLNETEAQLIGFRLMDSIQDAIWKTEEKNRYVLPDEVLEDENKSHFVLTGDVFQKYILGQCLLELCPPEVPDSFSE